VINLVYEAAKKSGIPAKKIWDLIYYLGQNGTLNSKALSKLTGIAKSGIDNVAQNLNSLINVDSDNYSLKVPIDNSNENSFITKDYKTEEDLWLLIKDRNFFVNQKRSEEFGKQRKAANRDLDQFYATSETVAKRGALLNYFGDIAGKRILLLGDDDLTSAAIATYKTAKEIMVLDIDSNILSDVTKISSVNGLNISTVEYDVRNALPKDLANRFDVVFTDPPYTKDGFSLFLSRAVEALSNKNSSARVYICYGNSDRAKERYLPIYETILKSNTLIRWVFDKFNRYNGAESIGSSSSLFVLDTTSKTQKLLNGNYKGKLYTNE
jgi:hypothetical protein